ncbi:MAG TPA: protocatechuate 3,4-dioxygenase subunit alpha [Pseudonocardiaceae bacterium]|jgi:protocatechuate 3,4-dioxygenase alpha subunit
MSELLSTPSQTVGPYLSLVLPWPDGPFAVAEGTENAVWITGTVYDGSGAEVLDALVETWQADGNSRFTHPDDPRGGPTTPGFRGFGRCPTDEHGNYRILTVKPGALPAPEGGTEAPHIDVSVFARGLLNRVITRIYFADEQQANAADPVLATVDVNRRTTLIARADGDGYRFDIHFQGEHETVFFDL